MFRAYACVVTSLSPSLLPEFNKRWPERPLGMLMSILSSVGFGGFRVVVWVFVLS